MRLALVVLGWLCLVLGIACWREASMVWADVERAVD